MKTYKNYLGYTIYRTNLCERIEQAILKYLPDAKVSALLGTWGGYVTVFVVDDVFHKVPQKLRSRHANQIPWGIFIREKFSKKEMDRVVLFCETHGEHERMADE